MKSNPFFSGLICGIALTLAAVITFVTYEKGPVSFFPGSPQAMFARSQSAQMGTRPADASGFRPLVSPSRGSADAPVTIIDFSDFHCPFCKKAAPVMKQIVDTYKDKVHFIFKNFALSDTPGQGSFSTHEAGVCAQEQGRFWPFYEAIYGAADKPDAAGLRKIAQNIGLNMTAFEACMKSDRPKKTIFLDQQEGKAKGVEGTPSFFINGQQVAGAYPFEYFKNIIDGILSGKPQPVPAAAQPAPAAPPPPPAVVQFDDLKGRPSEGPDNAPVTLVQFSDFHCPFCQRLEPTLTQVMKDYQGKVRKVWRHFPLPMHAGSARTHQAAECANQQGKFWAFHDKAFAHFGSTQGDEALNKIAEESGLNMKKFKKCMESQDSKDAVQKDITKGSASGVRGTPATFVNGRIMVGAQPYDAFKRMIDEELQKAKK